MQVKAIWLDDCAANADYVSLKRAMENAGLRVESALSEEMFFKSLEKDDYQVYIVDLMLEGITGVDVAQRLYAEKGGVPILFLSNFLGTVEIRKCLDPRARFATLEKPVLDPEKWAKEQLMPAVNWLLSKPVHWSPSKQIGQAVGLWSMDSEEVANVEIHRFLELQRDAARGLEELGDQIFASSSADWVMCVGPDARVVLWGSSGADAPTKNMVRGLERDHKSMPVVLTRCLEVDDLELSAPTAPSSWTKCPPPDQVKNDEFDWYPTIGMEINGHEIECHFDTGSPKSWVNYDYAVAEGVIEPALDHYDWFPQRLGAIGRKQSTYVSCTQPESTVVATRCIDGYLSVESSPIFVKDWNTSPLAKLCPVGNCPKSQRFNSTLSYCGARSGLFGRDLLRKNSFRLVLDSQNGRTYAIPPGDIDGHIDTYVEAFGEPLPYGYDPDDDDRLANGLSLAVEFFGRVTRGDAGRPLLGHVLAVTADVISYGGDEDQAIAAALLGYPLLHGAGAIGHEIGAKFGERVLSLIETCSEVGLSEAEGDWREQREHHLAHLKSLESDFLLIFACVYLSRLRELILDLSTQGAQSNDRYPDGGLGLVWYGNELRKLFSDRFSQVAPAFDIALADLRRLMGQEGA